jgi:hypothetical protein
LATLGNLGTTHDPAYRVRYHYPLVLRDLILEFNPSVICGEVHPTIWERCRRYGQYEDYWGSPASEYWDLVFPLDDERG